MTNIPISIFNSDSWNSYNKESLYYDYSTEQVKDGGESIFINLEKELFTKIPCVESTLDVDALTSTEYYNFVSSYRPFMFDDTMSFQIKYGLHDPNVYGFLPEENMKVKLGHLQEEMNEIFKAYENKDLNEFCDGILDLVYVGLGTLALMNMPANALWNDIQIRNLNKVRATADTVGKRGSTFDVVKKPGWTGPRTKEIIEEHLKYIDSLRSAETDSL